MEKAARMPFFWDCPDRPNVWGSAFPGHPITGIHCIDPEAEAEIARILIEEASDDDFIPYYRPYPNYRWHD